jgi:hypothetical protein
MKMKKPKLPSIPRIKKALYADWSLRVRARDGFKCLLCGATENITAHHWYCSDHHSHAARYAVDNGATLCYACHIRSVHSRADYVSVERVANAVGMTNSSMMGIEMLIQQELSIPLLRELWNAMRKRPIINMGCWMSFRGAKAFLFEDGHQIAVAGNVIRVPASQLCAGDYEVTAITKTPTGAYRYTLKRMEDGE